MTHHFLTPTQDHQPITTFEKVMTFINAKLTAIGVTVGSIATVFWYMTSSISSGGLGLAIGGSAAAITAISIVGAASLIFAIPIAYLVYRDLMSEAEVLNKEIQHSINKHDRNYNKILFELLRLRNVCSSLDMFKRHANIALNKFQSIINVSTLIEVINNIHIQLKNKRYMTKWRSLNDSTSHLKRSENGKLLSAILKDPNMVTNKDIQDSIVQQMTSDHSIKVKLKYCCRSIRIPTKTERGKAASYGIIAGLTIAGVTLGTGWTFPAMLIGVGLVASFPFLGWAILGASCIALGIIFGLGIGLCKERNLLREATKKKINKRNHMLTHAKTCINNRISRIAEQSTVVSNITKHEQQQETQAFTKQSKHTNLYKHNLLRPVIALNKRLSIEPIKISVHTP